MVMIYLSRHAEGYVADKVATEEIKIYVVAMLVILVIDMRILTS